MSENIDNSQMLAIFQKIVVTILFIAAKYEEIYPPNIRVFCRLLGIRKEELLDTEGQILSIIGFEFSSPTIHSFLEGYLSYTDFSENEEFLSHYLIQIALHFDELIFD